MFSPYGKFADGGRAFKINTPDLPRNWYNYMYTDSYITFTSQCGVGQGFLQDRLGNRLNLITARGMYAVTDDNAWSLCALPVYDKYDYYECEHRLGSTKITLEKYSVRSEYTLCVPNIDDKLTGIEMSSVKLTNTGSKAISIKLISYTENDLDGIYKLQGYNTMHAEKDNTLNGLHFEVYKPFYGALREMAFFTACSEKVTGWDCAKNAFIGTYGSVADPKALHTGGCTNSECTAEKLGFAIQTVFTLDPGESKTVVFSCGLTEGNKNAVKLADEWTNEAGFGKALKSIDTRTAERLGGVKLETPDENLNSLINYWLQYQTDLGSRWARVRHNGYRDIASDTECFATVNPALAWERIKRLLTYQYSNGYSPRTFIDGKICDNNFADCTVWLTFTVTSIIKELGKPELLKEEVEFNDGTSATVYEHLKRSVEFLYGFTGLHGLVQIWGGDWNDCMNTAGLQHKGVSIWLSIAWVRANRQFKELAQCLGNTQDAAACDEREAKMLPLIEKYGWDEKGGYYIYAYSDDDEKIGSSDCEEGAVFLNPQLWATLAGGLGYGHEEEALEHAYKLLDDPLGTRVSTPPYTQKSYKIGTIVEKAPGVQENGGVYLHSMCWKLAVDGIRKDSKNVRKDIDSIVPFRNEIVNGRAEPYIICNCYMGKETGYRYGTPGQSWRTASGQWFLKSMVNFVFGLTPDFNGLRLEPCLPEGWDEAHAVKQFRGYTYDIRYKRTGKAGITVNGKAIEGTLLPLENAEVTVTF